MRVLSIKINNILSISDIDLNIEDSGLVLFEGWNYDDNRANGAGKTAIFNALTFGLYDELPRKITASEILKKGAKNGYVEVVVSAGNDILKVRRERPKKESFEKNGALMNWTQKEFESHIKLSYGQFLISMYSAQTQGEKFLSLNDSSKKDFLLRLMNLSEFDECKTFIKSSIKGLEEALNSHLVQLTSYKSKLEVYSEQKIDSEQIKQQLELNEKSIAEMNKAILDLQNVTKPNLSNYIKLEEDLLSKMDEYKLMRAERSKLMGEYEKLSRQNRDFVPSEPDGICPHCNNDLKLDGGVITKADDIEALKKIHEKHLNSIKQQQQELKDAMDTIDNQLLKDKELKEILRKLKERKDKESQAYNSAVNNIAELKSSIQIKTSKNESLQAAIDNNLLVKDKILKLKNHIKAIESNMADLNIELELNNSVLAMFSPTGAPAYVLDSVIDSFNESIADNIGFIWPNASYKLQSYKEKAGGELVAKFSEELVVSGKERSVGSLSGGEFRSLSLVVDFAIINVLCKQFGVELNPIIMDEPFEGLDAVSRENVIELLEKMAVDRQIIVVDHMSEAKAMFTKIIKVEKRDGNSTIAAST